MVGRRREGERGDEGGRVTNFTLSFLLAPAVSSNSPLMWEIKKSECVNISLGPPHSSISSPPLPFSSSPLFSCLLLTQEKRILLVSHNTSTTQPPRHYALISVSVFISVSVYLRVCVCVGPSLNTCTHYPHHY